MIDIEKLISELRAINDDFCAGNNAGCFDVAGACEQAANKLEELKDKNMVCKYCAGGESNYQNTHNTKISINTFGDARTLLIECLPCPPYANCGLKDVSIRSAFIINHCPNCGRKLGG